MTQDPRIVWTSPYPSRQCGFLDGVAGLLTRPSQRALDSFLSCFILTLKEQTQLRRRFLYYFFYAPFLFVALVFTLLPCAVGYMLWIPVHYFRKPYRYSHVHGAENVTNGLAKTDYGFATVNVCLLPECVCKFNNLTNNRERAKMIGMVISEQQIKLDKNSKQSAKNQNTEINGFKQGYQNGMLRNRSRGEFHIGDAQEFDHAVCSEFSWLDFVLLQEVFNLECGVDIATQLHKAFPHIVWDARVDSWRCNKYGFNSGLMVASRFPFLCTNFNWFTDSCSQCVLNSKGLLQLKVELGQGRNGERIVGYLAVTHLQAYQGNKPIQKAQLDQVNIWVDRFRQETLQPNEIVAFDVLGGDFNVDNMSPVDRENWDHPVFSKYHDVCCVRPGEDQPWTVGTEMRQTPLHDELTSTPDGLRFALNDPALLQHYILNADIEKSSYKMATSMPTPAKGNEKPEISPVGGRRRIDRLLYRRGDGVRVTHHNPVTQLAGLTDHIPVTMSVVTDDVK